MNIQPGDFVVCRTTLECGTVTDVRTVADRWAGKTRTSVRFGNRVENEQPNVVPCYYHREASMCTVLIRPFVSEVKP